MRRSAHQEKSLGIAFVFLFCVILLVVGGVFLKLFLLYRVSSFDGNHQFIVAVNQEDASNAILVFNPQGHQATMLTVSGQNFSYKALDIPIDASVTTLLSSQIVQLTQNMLTKDRRDSNMTILDRLRLFLFINSLKPSDLHYVSVALPIDEATREKIFPGIFTDSTLFADNESVAVVNATGQTGMGTHVAHMLTTIGINVVFVTTGDKIVSASTLISMHPTTYTTQRLGRLFHVGPKISTQQGIADITLTIGKDSALLLY